MLSKKFETEAAELNVHLKAFLGLCLLLTVNEMSVEDLRGWVIAVCSCQITSLQPGS